jgi:hypothetical protein
MTSHEIDKDGYLLVDGRTVAQLTEAGHQEVEEVVKLYLGSLDVEYVGEYPWGSHVSAWDEEEARESGWIQ